MEYSSGNEARLMFTAIIKICTYIREISRIYNDKKKPTIDKKFWASFIDID